MKKLLTLFIILSMVVYTTSCDNGFDDLNVNPTASVDLDVNPKFAYLFLKSAGDEFEHSFTTILCAGQLTQQVIDTDFPQSSIYTIREDLQAAWWIVAYQNTIKSVVDIIAQLENEGNVGTEMGIARIWKAYLFHTIVDQYGDTPYFDAGSGFLTGNIRPAYDDAQEIYMDMLNEIEEGVAQIGSSSTLGAADLIYGGDTAKWKKFGNSLMLRLAMRIKNVDGASSSAWVAKAIAGGHGVMVGSAEMVASKTIVENASASDELAVLVAAVTAAGLVETLQSAGPFTVLAPTNAAFAKLPAGTVDTLLKAENIETLKTILTCHVVAAKAMAADVIKMAADNGGMAELGTVGGCILTAKYYYNKVTFTDENGNVATVTIADVPQKNGVIHVIDTVLLPKS